MTGSLIRDLSDELEEVRETRDRMRRYFNRLEAAVSHHRRAVEEDGALIGPETWDMALWKVRDKILRDYAEGEG